MGTHKFQFIHAASHKWTPKNTKNIVQDLKKYVDDVAKKVHFTFESSKGLKEFQLNERHTHHQYMYGDKYVN